MLNFDLSGKSLGIALLPYSAYDLSKKMSLMLYSIN